MKNILHIGFPSQGPSQFCISCDGDPHVEDGILHRYTQVFEIMIVMRKNMRSVLCSVVDQSGFVIEGNSCCKYYLFVRFHFVFLAAAARITSQLRKLDYSSPNIANKFSFIILQNK